MALGSNHVRYDPTAASGSRLEAETFVPELWSDEIVATYKSNLVMPDLVTVMNHVGKKGSVIHIPAPVRGTASRKTAQTQVTLIANTEGEKVFNIDQHWEYSRLIEDIVAVQAMDSLRQFYTNDAGYALAKNVDTALHAVGAGFAGGDANPFVAGVDYSKAVVGDGETAWDPTANGDDGNAAPLTDEGIRKSIQRLDDFDVPSMRRVLVIPPVEKRKLTGLPRFTEQAFTGESGGGNTIRNGLVGNVYGIPIYVSTNVAQVENDNEDAVQSAVLLFQKDGVLLFEQLRPRTQTQYKQEWLSNLFTADLIYGTGLLRPENGVALIVPNV